MSDERGIVKYDDPKNDPEWQQIVSDLFEEVHKDDLPEKVVECAELMLAGWPTYKIAKRLGVETKVIRGWLNRYPSMAVAVAKGRKILTQWRMSKLEQQYMQAIEKSEEILDLDLEDRAVNSKLLAVVAQQARYVISLFVGQKIDVNVKVSEGEQTLKAKQDALEYLASEMAKNRQENPVEVVQGTYRVEDVQPEAAPPPMLDQEGNPAFGELGVLDTNEEGTLCHICGERAKSLRFHLLSHKVKIKDYEILFMLPLGSVMKLEKSE